MPVLAGPGRAPGEIETNPDWAHDHEVLATLVLDAGEIERARIEYQKLSDAYPDDPAYSLFCGVLLAALGRPGDAERLYDRASPHLGGRELTREAASRLLSDLRASWTAPKE